MSQEVMTTKELAKYLDISTATVYKKVEYREIPFTKVGSLLRFPRWLIDQWLTEKAVRPSDCLYDEFVRLHRSYHLKQFLASKGLRYELLTQEQLVFELQVAIEELKDPDTGAGGPGSELDA